MNVFSDSAVMGAREIKIDNMHNVLDVKSTRGDTGCDEDRASGRAEGTPVWFSNTVLVTGSSIDLQSILTLALRAIRVNRSTGESHIVQVVVQKVRLRLGIDEDQSTGRRHSKQQIIETLLFQMILRIDNLPGNKTRLTGNVNCKLFVISETYVLVDVDVSTAWTPNANANMVIGKILASQLTAGFIERRRKHEVAMIGILVHVFFWVSSMRTLKSQCRSYLHRT